MKTTVTVDSKKKTITIVLPLEEATSASGKSLVIGSTRGNMVTDQMYKDKPVIVGINVYTKK